jgi:hypothetical protein
MRQIKLPENGPQERKKFRAALFWRENTTALARLRWLD